MRIPLLHCNNSQTKTFPIKHSLMKLLVPVYDLSLVPAVVTAAQAGSHIAAIVNPDSGPGRNTAVINSWKPKVQALRAAGAQVLFYVDLVQFDGDQGIAAPSAGKEKSEATLKAEMDKYVAKYGKPTGWFFDDLRDHTPIRQTRLAHLVTHGGGFTVANPGTATSQNYLQSNVTALVTFEDDSYAASVRPVWEATQGAHLGVMAMSQADFHPALQLAQQRKINLFYALTASNSATNPYAHLPSYFAAMAAAV
jgi:hypothetical protein